MFKRLVADRMADICIPNLPNAALSQDDIRAFGVPKDRRVPWRIDINIGDITSEGDDVYG
jgi:hypothetical protein